ncbi:homing endonuclease [Pseudomonas phage vB_PF_Y1-MI]|nr:homing endonuclease [Pseudomonas phage vB_PF_Y1-MI]
MAIGQKFWFLYKTTNLVEGYIYIGVHRGTEADKYLGSGILLKRAIRKYGREIFSREILERFDSADAAYAREAEVVDEAFVKSPYTYNIALGGRGHDGRNLSEHTKLKLRKPKSDEHRAAISRGKTGLKMSDQTRAEQSARRIGKTHTEETKQKMSALRSGRKASIVECPHCGKTGGAPAMKQWHFNNCKHIGDK